MEEKETFEWQFGFIVLFALVTFLSVGPALGGGVATLVFLAVVGLYISCLRSFGSNSKIEMGVVLSILVVLLAVLVPVLQRAKLNQARMHQKALQKAKSEQLLKLEKAKRQRVEPTTLPTLTPLPKITGQR